MVSEFRDFNVRQMQAYAALCLFEFCKHFGIQHAAIAELIRHLLSILTTEDITEWEDDGCQIELQGRGDPLPEDIMKLVMPERRETLKALIDHCIEVGIVDMYGAPSHWPLTLLEKCVGMLRQSGVVPPSPEMLKKYRRDPEIGGGTQLHKEDFWWGEAVSENALKEISELYQVSLS